MSKPDRNDRGAQFTALPSTADEIRALLKKDDTKSAIDAFDGAVAIGDRGLASEALARVRTGPKTTDYVKKNVLPRMQREFVQKFGAEMTESLQALQEVSAFRLGKRFAQKAISKASGAASFDTVMRGGKSVRVKRDLGGAGGGQFVSQQRAMVQAASRMIRLRRQVGRLEGDLSRKGVFDKPLPSDPIQRAAEIRKRQLERLRKTAPKSKKKKRPRPEVVVPVAQPRPEATSGSDERSADLVNPSEAIAPTTRRIPSKYKPEEEKVLSRAQEGATFLGTLMSVPRGFSGDPIEVSWMPTVQNAAGKYTLDRNDIGGFESSTILLASPSAEDSFVFWHEFGHYMDWELFPRSADIPTPISGRIAPGELMHDWWQAVENSRGFREFRDALISDAEIGGEKEKALAEYFLRTREIWARAFSQWVATRYGMTDIVNHPTTTGRSQFSGTGWSRVSSQWDDDDFAPIAAEIEKLFEGLGWLK